ncbi:MAG TPA: hypothetical protein VGR88_06715, partial [Ktedonobacterales bacterium]|nr:hypothetical protein [Ktedonobacterales bacterium]
MSTTERDVRTSITLELTVIEGLTVPRGEAYVTSAALAALECAPGDVVVIQGPRVTAARINAWPEYALVRSVESADITANGPSEGRDDRVIAMDGLVRQNAGAALGDQVRLRRVTTQPAISAALVPLAGAANLREPELRHIAQSLRGQIVTAGDLVRVAGLGLAARDFQVL